MSATSKLFSIMETEVARDLNGKQALSSNVHEMLPLFFPLYFADPSFLQCSAFKVELNFDLFQILSRD